MHFTYYNRLAGALSVLHWAAQPRPTAEARLAYARERAQAQQLSVDAAISRNFAERLQGQLMYFATALSLIGGICVVVAYELTPGWGEVALSVLPLVLLVGLALAGRRLPERVR